MFLLTRFFLKLSSYQWRTFLKTFCANSPLSNPPQQRIYLTTTQCCMETITWFQSITWKQPVQRKRQNLSQMTNDPAADTLIIPLSEGTESERFSQIDFCCCYFSFSLHVGSIFMKISFTHIELWIYRLLWLQSAYHVNEGNVSDRSRGVNAKALRVGLVMDGSSHPLWESLLLLLQAEKCNTKNICGVSQSLICQIVSHCDPSLGILCKHGCSELKGEMQLLFHRFITFTYTL